MRTVMSLKSSIKVRFVLVLMTVIGRTGRGYPCRNAREGFVENEAFRESVFVAHL